MRRFALTYLYGRDRRLSFDGHESRHAFRVGLPQFTIAD